MATVVTSYNQTKLDWAQTKMQLHTERKIQRGSHEVMMHRAKFS